MDLFERFRAWRLAARENSRGPVCKGLSLGLGLHTLRFSQHKTRCLSKASRHTTKHLVIHSRSYGGICVATNSLNVSYPAQRKTQQVPHTFAHCARASGMSVLHSATSDPQVMKELDYLVGTGLGCCLLPGNYLLVFSRGPLDGKETGNCIVARLIETGIVWGMI